ncbi:hypothetical protein ACXR2T_08050 [Leucobacter sp. HY1910]
MSNATLPLSLEQRSLNRRLSALRHAGPWIADSPTMQSGVASLNIAATFSHEGCDLDAAQADELAARLITDPVLVFAGISMFNRTPFRKYRGTSITAAADLLELPPETIDAARKLGPRPAITRNIHGKLTAPLTTKTLDDLVRSWVLSEHGTDFRIGAIPQVADARAYLRDLAERFERLEQA